MRPYRQGVTPGLVDAVAGAGVLAHSNPDEPPSASVLLLDWHADPMILPPLLLVAGAYLLGVRVLSERGDRWPVARTASFLAGLAVVAWATVGGLAAYDETSFTVHAFQHMLLAVVAPLPLALGAPVTLALRTLPGTTRRGVRGLLNRLLHSRVAHVAANPLVTLAVFVANPFVLYFSGLYEATLRSDLLHAWIHVHFLVVGCAFFWPLLGLDPVPGRVAPPFRLLAVFAALPFHAFLGVALMSSSAPVAGTYYLELAAALEWYGDPLGDTQTGGAVMWAFGDLVGLAVASVLFVQWLRDDDREARRTDRAADRAVAAGADLELDAYNARLSALARSSPRRR